jgi:hypothetical protein
LSNPSLSPPLCCSLLLATCRADSQPAGGGGYDGSGINPQAGQPTHSNTPYCQWLPKHHLPVCGHNGKDYSSLYDACLGVTSPKCLHRCPCHPGGMPPPARPPPSCPGCAAVLCPALYDPVCCDGYTFSNSCLAKCCGYGSSMQCYPGACPSP